MNKTRTIVAASALAVAGAAGLIASPAAAGCGVTITADNDENYQVTVNWAQSEVRTSTVVLGQRIPGSWRTLSNYSTNIAAEAEVDRAFTLDLPCNIDRQYRLRVSGGGNTWWEYQNEVGPTGSWTRSVNPFIDLER